MTPIYFEIEKDNDGEEWLVKYTIESWLPDFEPTYNRAKIMSKTMFIALYQLWIKENIENEEQQRH